MTSPLQLTFGLELEFIVLYDPVRYKYDLARLECGPRTRLDQKFEILVRKHIIYALNAIKLPVTGYRESDSTQKWTITSDDSIDLGGRPNCVGVEMKSPAYNISEIALAQVTRAIKLLTDSFDVIVDDSCGVHVHVGNQRKGFPLQTVKQFCMLTAIFEPYFDSLHPSERIFGLGSGFARGPTSVFIGINPWDTALLIQDARSHKELVKRYAREENLRDRCHAYNLLPLVHEPMYHTIEFRQHEATTEPTAICKWIALACGLIHNAHTIPYNDLTQLIDEFAFDSRPPTDVIIDLLHRLQLNEWADFYSQRERYNHAKPLHAWVDKTLEDGMDLASDEIEADFVNGKQIVKTLAKWAALGKGYTNIKYPQSSRTSSSWSDRETVGGAVPGGLSQAERQVQMVPPRLLTAEGQRVQNLLDQLHSVMSGEIKGAELAAGCTRQRASLPAIVSRV